LDDANPEMPCDVPGSPTPELPGDADAVGFELLADASPIGIFYSDPSGHWLYANPRWFEITGMTREDAQNDGWLRLVHPDDADDVTRALASGVDGEFFRRFRLVAGDGQVRWVHGRSAAVHDDDGAIVGHVGSLADVTQQVESQAERHRLTKILETTTDLVVTVDSDGVITYLNGAARRALGLDDLAPLPKLAHTLSAESRWAYESVVLPELVAFGTWTGDLVLRGHDGTEIPVSVAATVHLDEGDRTVAYISVVARDMTERKQLEARLIDSEARFRSLVQNSSDLIAVTDASGTLTYVSPSAARLLGWRPDQLVGCSLVALVHPDDAHVMRTRAMTPAGNEAPEPFDVRMHTSDGTDRLFEVVVTNLLADPTVRGYVANARDVTATRGDRAELAALAQRQASVAELGRRALEGEDIDALFNAATHALAGALGVEFTAVLELQQPDQEAFLLRWGVGWPDGWLGTTVVTAGFDSQAGQAMRATDPVAVTGLGPGVFPASRPLHELGIDSGVDVRIGDRDNPFGVLAVHTTRTRRFHTDELHFIQSVAHVLAAAVGRRRAEEETRHRALHDDLTGLPNRALLMDRLEQAIARGERSGGLLAVMFCDVDQFKVINDSLGHSSGDLLLVAVARRLREVLRPGDTVARFGGDEFVVVCENLQDEHAASEIARRMAESISEPIHLGDREIVLTSSLGIAFGRSRGTDPDALIADADAAMYHAKARGRARAEVFDDRLRAGNLARLDTANALRRALEAGELVLHYQPQIDLVTGATHGVEALLRWERPDCGLVLPAEFVPVAEDSGLILPIGVWVLREAALQLRRWKDQHPGTKITVAVNLSARQLADPGLPGEVADAIAGAGIDPADLKLEITESAVMEDAAWSQAALESLCQLGVQLVIDDFGTGYSSLSYLKQFPVHQLKVDRSFVSGLHSGTEDWAIVEAVISMARALQLEVVAEGVETPEQASTLMRLGCTAAQGFLFAEPRPADEVFGI